MMAWLICYMQGAARNKMLVKGASSYNALKRAIKQDLVDAGGKPVQDPNLLYEVRIFWGSEGMPKAPQTEMHPQYNKYLTEFVPF